MFNHSLPIYVPSHGCNIPLGRGRLCNITTLHADKLVVLHSPSTSKFPATLSFQGFESSKAPGPRVRL